MSIEKKQARIAAIRRILRRGFVGTIGLFLFFPAVGGAADRAGRPNGGEDRGGRQPPLGPLVRDRPLDQRARCGGRGSDHRGGPAVRVLDSGGGSIEDRRTGLNNDK